ncbi:DUF1298 domain-containing protein [Gordonia sp. HNM0687]|uniref:diacylglycerol O-acyltransferase n=1 Tax=Gordonia mangrovi TaxID=2665643 RepID=A0A6L7GR42_9ACTN|nr:wax ester/triacylglycerol synthase domain-containing protein [Gordonia mangrovi]MXP22409.1 DUF1298 domain-containing protein [Gordonia mangrovi]UVF77708.1 WS/DGAT domain-containing protein [Gordonia mangrovi]
MANDESGTSAGDGERIRAMDAVFVDAEEPGPSVAIGSVIVADGPAPTLQETRDFVASRIALTPRLQQRIVPSSLRIRRPVWEHAEADLTHHIREIDLGGDGGDAALEQAVSRIMEIPLDFERPLWDMHLLTGLADGFGMVTRVHHVVADGQGSVLMLGHLLDTDAAGTTTLTDALLGAGRELAPSVGTGGSPRDHLVASVADGGDRLMRALRTSLHPGEAATAVVDAGRRAGEQFASAAEAVRTWTAPRFGSLIGGSPGVRRHWHMVRMPIADVKAVKNAFGCTLNDVVMAMVSGGYGLMMQRRAKPTDGKYLKVVIPVSVRAPFDVSSNNQVSGLLTQLPVSGTAVERLTWITDHINKVKHSGEAESVKVITDMFNVAPAAIQTVAVRHRGPLPEWMVDTLVTNVPGPPFPTYYQGRRVRQMLPIVALGRPLWCLVAVLSFDGELSFGISTGEGGEQAGRDIREGIRQTLAELQTASG